MKSVPLFPVAIGLSNFGESNHDLNVALINDIFAEYDEDRKGRVGAGLGNWHSETALELKYESFAKLRDQIEQEANSYAEHHGYERGIKVKKLWANISEQGEAFMPHTHGDVSMTGVYYPVHYIDEEGKCYYNYDPKAMLRPGSWNGKDGGSLVLFNPWYPQRQGLKKSKKPSPFTVDTYYTYPTSGLLVLFPPEIIHMVTPFKENPRRLSISYCGDY